MMVFGGSGNLGKYLLKQLSTMPGLSVVAASRNPSKAQPYANVKWVQADPKDRRTYQNEMNGCGIVVSVLGSDEKKQVDIYSKGIPEIIKCME